MRTALRKRPVLLTIICIIGYIWVVFSFISVFSPGVKKLGDWYPALFGLVAALSFISYIGVWHMKQWGVNLFIATFFFKQILHVLTNELSYVGIALSVIFIACFLVFYRRMDTNL